MLILITPYEPAEADQTTDLGITEEKIAFANIIEAQ